MQAEIVMAPERGHADTFHFSFTTKDGQLTGRVSVALVGRPDNRSREEKMRAARIRVEHLARAFATASSERRYAQHT
jgi:hypothetical protein